MISPDNARQLRQQLSNYICAGWDADGNFMVVDRIGLFRKNTEWNAMLSDLVAFDMERYNLPVNTAHVCLCVGW